MMKKLTDWLPVLTLAIALAVAVAILVVTEPPAANASPIQPVVTVPANGSITVAVEPGLVWYGWHAGGHGASARYITVPACPRNDEALILSNSSAQPRSVKVYVDPGPKVSARGTDNTITAVATCDPNAVPLPGGRTR